MDLLSIDTDILPEYVESDETLMKIYRRFGFYPLLNKNGDPVAYMFRTDGNSHVRISDFYM